MMGGRIWIESELGHGSTFAFIVKAKRGPDEPKGGLSSPGVNWATLRVLTVDDEPEILGYFEEISREFGFTCDLAASGDEAIRLIEKNGAYDICFVDWKMPGMNGIELSRKIKGKCSGKSIVTMISAVEWNVIEADARNAGVDKFIPKPLFPSAIVNCINECLGVVGGLPGKAPGKEEISFDGYRVLLAEDMEINREIVLALLEPTGFEIDCAENGLEAVNMFAAAPEKYDVIFMDVQMPEMDGMEATRRIRALDEPAAKTITIIAMTANVFREDIEKCLAAGMNDHVGKPLDIDEVFVKLRKHLPLRVG
jgi:CheY-like chemotaxis protein